MEKYSSRSFVFLIMTGNVDPIAHPLRYWVQASYPFPERIILFYRIGLITGKGFLTSK